jgi:hypothetical protein
MGNTQRSGDAAAQREPIGDRELADADAVVGGDGYVELPGGHRDQRVPPDERLVVERRHPRACCRRR